MQISKYQTAKTPPRGVKFKVFPHPEEWNNTYMRHNGDDDGGI